jgi:hypothetical protein
MKYKYILRPDKHNDDMKKMLDRRSNWIQSFDKMRQLKNNNWNLLWKLTDNIEIFGVESELYFLGSENTSNSILKNQIVNHLPFSKLITQKYNLINTLQNYYSTVNPQCQTQLFEILPETFIIDKNTDIDSLKFENVMYIVKPEDAFAGLGISVFNDKNKLLQYISDGLNGKLVVYNYTKTTADPEKQYLKFGENDKWIVQKYIMNPLRIEGRKFDIRVNVLVNNDYDIYFSPIIIIRTSSLPYLPILTGDDKIDKATHITNNAFQKMVPLFYGKYEESNILRLEQLQQYFDLSYGKNIINIRRDFFPRMKELVCDAILSIRTQVQSGRTERKFYEHFGFDFLIDDNFRTWLIEVNQNPSLDWDTTWSRQYIDFFLEDIGRKAIDPYFPSKDYRSPKGKFPITPELPWKKEVTQKQLPLWFKPSSKPLPKKNLNEIFELIYSETKSISKIKHQMSNTEDYFEDSNPYRFTCNKSEEFYYPFGKPKISKN